MKTVITFGTFDLFHIGHLKIIERAHALGDKLVVGISTDSLTKSKKGILPIYSEQERFSIVQAIKGVDECFYEDSLELKREYILTYSANILVMGDDWKGEFDYCDDICKVVYLARTSNISTSSVKDVIRT